MTNHNVVKTPNGKLITVGQLKQIFKDESDLWKHDFFEVLRQNKISYSKKGGCYALTGMILAAGLDNEPDILTVKGEVLKTSLRQVMDAANDIVPKHVSSSEKATFQKGKTITVGTILKSIMSHGAPYYQIVTEDGKKQYINAKYKV